MPRLAISAVAACAALVGVSFALASDGDQSDTGSKTIRVASKTVAADVVDTGQSGPTPGDLFVFRNQLRRDGEAFGRLEVACMFVKLEEEYACHGTAFLPGGRLAVSGALSLDQRTNLVPIVGGTGRYRRARGTLSATDTGDDTSTITFTVSR
jgi:hypothetical protein